MELGFTYLADRLNEDGSTIESALDHLYLSEELINRVKSSKLKDSGTDHVPILAVIEQLKPENKMKNKVIERRCMKNFNITDWNSTLARETWEEIAQTEDVSEMANIFTCTPKNFTACIARFL